MAPKGQASPKNGGGTDRSSPGARTKCASTAGAKRPSRPTLDEATGLLASNRPLEFRLSTELIFKILNNITGAPEEPNFRSIKRSSRAFSEQLAVAKGGVRFLRAMGFDEEGEGDATCFVLPAGADFDVLRQGKLALKEMVKRQAAAVAEARRVQDELGAAKLRDLQAVSKQNTQKRDEAAERERLRLLEGIRIDREDRVRQADPVRAPDDSRH